MIHILSLKHYLSTSTWSLTEVFLDSKEGVMPEPLENCEHCNGSGEIALLGPNTTECPCLEREVTLNLEDWQELVWEPIEEEVYTHPPGIDILCFTDGGPSSKLAFRYIGEKQWQWVCASACENCNGKSGTITTFSLEDTVQVLEHDTSMKRNQEQCYRRPEKDGA